MASQELSKRLADLLAKAGVNVQGVTVLGCFVHVTSYAKYRDRIVDLLTSAGACIEYERDGDHLDGSVGLRVVGKF
jgi:hypothetical protein